MEFSQLEIVYWHWLLLGIILAGAEMFLASFTLLWFGLGALVVGLLLLVFPSLSLGFQITLWIILSSVCAVFWFCISSREWWIKPKRG